MSEHDSFNEYLPLYVSGQLDEARQRAVAAHLQTCAECQADLVLWRSVAGEIQAADSGLAAPAGLAQKALKRARSQPRRVNLLQRAAQIVVAQAPLVRRDIWPASTIVIAIGYVLAVMAGNAGVIRALAPLVSAACIAVIYGAAYDPALELALSTPTSPRQILLARLTLVFGYNFVLTLAASLALLPVLPVLQSGTLEALVLGWLGPMAFLSSAALLISLATGAGAAVAVTYLAWLAQFLPESLVRIPNLVVAEEIKTALGWYQQFWLQPGILIGLSILLMALTVWLAGWQESSLGQFAES
jgi:hypothetical protein